MGHPRLAPVRSSTGLNALYLHPALEVAANKAEVAANLDVRQTTAADGLVDPARPDREELGGGG